MLRAGRYIRLSLAIAAAIVCANGFVFQVPVMAQKIPLKDAIQGLEPQDVWQNFYDVTLVPRYSHHEDKIRDFLVNFAKDLKEEGLGIEYEIDGAGNLIIKKPATPGMENRKGVILQAHMDMVAKTAPGIDHNFDTDGIVAYVEDDWVKAEGTTLGADDGIGLALAMAVLQSKTMATGPLEVLFTVDEEDGMSGALGLQPGWLNGEILINLDGEVEGEFTNGSAGGELGYIRVTYDETGVPRGMLAYRVAVQGLIGGHSGMNINKGQGNAAKLLVRFLKDAAGMYGLRVAQIDAGSAANSIPSEGSALVLIPAARETEFLDHVAEYERILKNELGAVETTLSVTAVLADLPRRVMHEKSQRDLVNALYGTPQGVIRMSDNVAGLVETSTNMGVVSASNRVMEVENRIRSSVDTSMDDVGAMLSSVWELVGGSVEFSGRYPGWKPNPDSPIVHLMSDVYMGLFDKEATVVAIHAGLECGTIYGTYPNLDMISIGPTMKGVHSVDERLYVPSVKKVMDLLVETLRQIPEK